MTSSNKGLWHSFRQEALHCYDRYRATQRRLDKLAAQALEAASNDKRAASLILLSDTGTEAGYLYNSLVSDRDSYMRQAALASQMALMLASTDYADEN